MPSPAGATIQSPPASAPRRLQLRRCSSWLRMSLALLATLASFGCVTLAQEHGPSPSLSAVESLVTTPPDIIMPTTDATRPGRPDPSSAGEANPDRPHRGDSLTSVAAVVSGASSTSAATPSPLPSPFDDPQSSLFKFLNGDDKCPDFMTALLSNPIFKSCYPLSMLLQTSTGFFNAQKQLPSLVGVLDAACKVNVSSCSDFLNRAADNLTAVANCKAELDQGQTRVLQAWRGLKAYRTLYAASCLQDPSTGMYCFADGVSNLNNPSDSYLYFMPYGVALPGASTPSCSKCTSETMRVYHAASASRSDFLSDKYEAAAHQINVMCGPEFVNSTLPAAEAAAYLVPPPTALALLASILAVAALGLPL